MELVFIYGSLVEPDVQRMVLGREAAKVPDILEGYRLAKTIIGRDIYPVVEPSQGDYVEGFTISVSERELELMDEYETAAYRREKVALASGKEAWAYLKSS